MKICLQRCSPKKGPKKWKKKSKRDRRSAPKIKSPQFKMLTVLRQGGEEVQIFRFFPNLNDWNMALIWWYMGERCCHICPRDSCPRRPWSKGTNVQGTVVQGDFGPRRLLSKEAFTSDKLAQIIFFILYWILRYWLIIKWQNNNMNSP